MAELHDQASKVGAEAGSVHVDGPKGVAYSMTPDAAQETSDRLAASAAEARTQMRNAAGDAAI